MPTKSFPAESPDLESSTEAYASRFAGSIGKYFLDIQLGIVQQMLPNPSGCRILDIGGGHGQLTPPLLHAGYDMTVLGSDDSCIERLNQSTISTNKDYEFVTGNLLDLPFKENSFDFVLAFRLLPHLKNWPRFIDEICRVAKQSVVLDYPDLRSVNWFAERMFSWKKKVEKNTRPYRCFHKREVINAFQNNQFRSFQSLGQFVLPMALHRLLKNEWMSKLVESFARSVGLTGWFGSPVILKATCH